MYQNILLATDGSDAARRATEHAIELADQLGAKLHLLSVSEDGPQATDKQDEMRTDHQAEANEAVEEAERTASSHGVDTSTVVRHGVPQEEIIDVAETNAIDLIVMIVFVDVDGFDIVLVVRRLLLLLGFVVATKTHTLTSSATAKGVPIRYVPAADPHSSDRQYVRSDRFG